jgi:hypothetical protein
MDSVLVLRVKLGFDAFSMRIFTSYEKMYSYINAHPLTGGFRYEYELVKCNPID